MKFLVPPFRSLYGCRCGDTKTNCMKHWRVMTRHGNYSAFNGYRFQHSDYSSATCLVCGCCWRTRAKYVNQLTDATQEELMQRIEV